MKTPFATKKLSLIISLTVLSSLTACKQSTSEKQAATLETVEVNHKLGTVDAPKNPEKFVVLDFSVLENLDTLGLKPIGLPKQGMPQYLDKFETDISIADVGTIAEVNLEEIYSLQPQLIISGVRLEEQYEELNSIAPTIQPSFDGSQPFKTFKANLDYIGKVFDRQEEVDKLYKDLVSKANILKEKASQENLTALIIMHNKGKFSAYGKGSRFGIIHDFIGIQEAKEGLGTHRHGNVVSSEYILEANPDVLFVIDRNLATASGQPLDKSFVENVLVKQTDAYKNGKIIYLDSEAWYLAGGGVKSINIMLEEIGKAF